VAGSAFREPEPQKQAVEQQKQAVEHLQRTDDRTNAKDVRTAKDVAPQPRNQTGQDSTRKRHPERPPQHAYRVRF
jgi:hypothetical protein